jgi:predicted Zn-dependent protease
MPSNELHHGYTLTSLFIEAKFAKSERQWSRFGRGGETNGGTWIQDARKRYNKAHRKASRTQLSRYQAPAEESHESTGCDDNSFFDWCDLITDAETYFESC